MRRVRRVRRVRNMKYGWFPDFRLTSPPQKDAYPREGLVTSQAFELQAGFWSASVSSLCKPSDDIFAVFVDEKKCKDPGLVAKWVFELVRTPPLLLFGLCSQGCSPKISFHQRRDRRQLFGGIPLRIGRGATPDTYAPADESEVGTPFGTSARFHFQPRTNTEFEPQMRSACSNPTAYTKQETKLCCASRYARDG